MTNTIVQQDAVELLRSMNTETVPLIIADPPYGIGYHSNRYKGKNPHSTVAHDWNMQIGEFAKEVDRVLTAGGALYLFCRWDVSPLWTPAVGGQRDLKIKTKIVWVKNSWSAGDLKGSFGNQYEEILFVAKGRHLLRGRRWPNVWPFNRIPSKSLLCPTQKPVELLERIVASSSDRGDLVVDPFAGSGSTGLAARNQGRQFILGDIDGRMVDMARKRLGLPADDPAKEPNIPPAPTLEIPDPADWGIHPEDLMFIKNELCRHADELDKSGTTSQNT